MRVLARSCRRTSSIECNSDTLMVAPTALRHLPAAREDITQYDLNGRDTVPQRESRTADLARALNASLGLDCPLKLFAAERDPGRSR